MKHELVELTYTPLQESTTYARPPEPPVLVHLEDPALHVMTDFKYVKPVTVDAGVAIDDALEKMKTSGVRLLLVTGTEDEILGMVTAADIQGDKPIKLAQESRLQRSDMKVEMIMDSPGDIPVLNAVSVGTARVGHIVDILKHLGQQHVLVVEVDEKSGSQKVIGLFSTSQISRQLWRDVSDDITASHQHSFTEIVRETG